MSVYATPDDLAATALTPGALASLQVPAPRAPAAALVSTAGALSAGVYRYRRAWKTADGITEMGPEITVTVVAPSTAGKVALSAMELPTDRRVTGQVLYRTAANGTDLKVHSTLGTEVSGLTDNTADSALGAARAVLDPNTTAEADKVAVLAAASAKADGYLASRFRLPLVAWGADLTGAVCAIAAYDLISRRGLSPQASLETLQRRLDDAIFWLKDVAAGKVTPQVTETEPAALTSARVYSNDPRGW